MNFETWNAILLRHCRYAEVLAARAEAYKSAQQVFDDITEVFLSNSYSDAVRILDGRDDFQFESRNALQARLDRHEERMRRHYAKGLPFMPAEGTA